MSGAATKRRYRQRARAESTERTRARIVDAALALHETVGPAATTISAIAERAGVQRLTVYRHFPDETSLLAACDAVWTARHPAPDPSIWRSRTDPVDRFDAALRALWTHYRESEPMLASVVRDGAARTPESSPTASRHGRLVETLTDDLSLGWTTDPDRGGVVRVAIGHAVAFETWRSLTRAGGLTDDEAADVLVGMVEAAAEPLA
jgi:AcrR family transcriptional regulator